MVQAQRFLQIELFNNPQTIKFYPNDKICIKTLESEDEWLVYEIEDVIPDENIIVYPQGYLPLDQITHIRVYKDIAKAVSIGLSQFGFVWLGFGGLAHAFSDFEFGWDTLAIGLVAIVTGWILKKFAAKKDYTIGKKARLRILDIRFPTPDELSPALKIKR